MLRFLPTKSTHDLGQDLYDINVRVYAPELQAAVARVEAASGVGLLDLWESAQLLQSEFDNLFASGFADRPDDPDYTSTYLPAVQSKNEAWERYFAALQVAAGVINVNDDNYYP